MYSIKSKLESIYKSEGLPSVLKLDRMLSSVLKTLKNEDVSYRFPSETSKPGSLVSFSDALPVIIVPDLHARSYFFKHILDFKLPESLVEAFPEKKSHKPLTVLDALEQKKIRLLCLGDALHSEARGKLRWYEAETDFMNGKFCGQAMTSEMKEGLTLIQMIIECKCRFPEHFHFLRGNHENILNERKNGNMPFIKYSHEGRMVTSFMLEKYGRKLTEKYAEFEYALPLVFRTPDFIASHAEPLTAYSEEQLINACNDSETAFGLIWTANDESYLGSVEAMLNSLLPQNPDAVWFSGHRPVFDAAFKTRCNGRLFQLHNPEEENIAIVNSSRKFNPETDIYSVKTEE